MCLNLDSESAAEGRAASSFSSAQRRTISNRNAPISSLPHEILALIFACGQQLALASKFTSHFYLDTDSDATESPTQIGLGFEVIISHVTSYWRDVAINEPRLWNNIHITSRGSYQELAIYLERSKTCLLNVRLDLRENAVGDLVFSTLLPHVGRWRRFSTESNREGQEDALFAHLHGLAAPHLEHFSIYVNAVEHLELMPNNINDPFPQIFTGGAPALSFVRLACHAVSFFRPPLTSMTTLHLDQTAHLPMSYTHFCQVLTASPVLANLSIYGDMIGMETWPPPATAGDSIKMPALRSLRICGIGGLVYCGVLLGISAPALDSLVLKDVLHHDLDQLWDSPQMPKFPALQSLTFCDFECTESTYNKFFLAFPAVTHFASLHSSLYTPRVLNLLGGSGSGDTISSPTSALEERPPWPRLHTVTLLFDFDDERAIKTMVRTRIQLEHPLVKLRLGTAREGNKLRALRLAEWLGECVQVEGFSGVDPWPVDLEYVDEDDLLF